MQGLIKAGGYVVAAVVGGVVKHFGAKGISKFRKGRKPRKSKSNKKEDKEKQ